jgi:hypothetical protein
MNKNKQYGFSAVEALLILVIVGILGFVGWYVWNANNKANKSLDNAAASGSVNATPSKKKQTSSAPQADPTADWTTYSSKNGNFSLKYPSNWVKAKLPSDGCDVNDNFLLLAPDSKSLGIYCSEGSDGQIAVDSNKISEGFIPKYTEGDGYKDVTNKSVTVDGVTGTRQSATAEGQENAPALGALPDGTKVIFYSFTTNGKIYTAEYDQRPSYTDVLNDFELMITKTLKFSS